MTSPSDDALDTEVWHDVDRLLLYGKARTKSEQIWILKSTVQVYELDNTNSCTTKLHKLQLAMHLQTIADAWYNQH